MILPSQLSYQRSMSPGIAVFSSVDCEGKTSPIEIQTIRIVGQKGSAAEVFKNDLSLKESVSASDLAGGNIQAVDYCCVPPNAEAVECTFSITFDASARHPRICSEPQTKVVLGEFFNEYAAKGGLRYLASRYLSNIVNGSWLWRNQNTLNTDIEILSSSGLKGTFSQVHLKRFEQGWCEENEIWTPLLNEIEEAFQNPKKYLSLNVTAKCKMGVCQEIHPSQAMVEKEQTDRSRTYQHTIINNKRIAILGAYKISAAISKIDNWHEASDQAVRVGSYGVDKLSVTVYRHPETGKDIFSLLLTLEETTEKLRHCKTGEIESQTEAHFIMANMIKGGLFGKGGDAK